MLSNKEITIRQIGEFCTNTHCRKCPIQKWNEESGLYNTCMESLRLPEVSKIMLEQIKNRRTEKEQQDNISDTWKQQTMSRFERVE